VLTIEHNLDVIKTADYLIDMGPEGGTGGGYVVATGTPEYVAQVANSHTGSFLKPMLFKQGQALADLKMVAEKRKPYGKKEKVKP
jgi:excinuclease ABC subunit A